MAAPELHEHDVVRYAPTSSWCLDGMAKAVRRRDGSIVLCETYWAGQGNDSVVRPDTYEIQFNLGDYDRVQQWTYDRHSPADRQLIPAQHGYCTELYVRKGAVESTTQIIDNARADLATAEQQFRLAQSELDWRRSELARLLAAVVPADTP